MASEAETQQMSALLERLLTRHTDLFLFVPFILGFANAASAAQENNGEPNQNQNQEAESQSERIILINPFTRGMAVIEGGAASMLDSILREFVNKSGMKPASKSSIEAMPSVIVGESDEGGECVICLEEWEEGESLKEMPCKHRFHGNCIEKWLGIHGCCPICRYKMPVEDDEFGNKRDGERRRFGRGIWVSFSLNDSNTGTENPSVPSIDVSTQRPECHQMEN